MTVALVAVHADGRRCRWEPYWVGNVRDGFEAWGFWYRQPGDPPDARRWCGLDHDPEGGDSDNE